MHDTDREWDKLNRDEQIVRWCCALAIAFLLALFAWTCSLAVGAPAPLPTPPKKPVLPVLVARLEWKDLAGAHLMSWGGSDWDTLLRPDGTYRCELTGGGASEWVGHWWIDFEGRLAVSEACLDNFGVPGPFSEWAVRWKTYKGGLVSRDRPTGTVILLPSGDECVTFVLVRKVVRRRAP